MQWRIILLIGLLALVGCRQQTPTAADVELQIDLQVDPEPATAGEAMLVITVRDAAGQPISDATVTARGDMNHAGMVPVIESAENGADGVYAIPFEWTMAGDWIVEVTVALASGETVTQSFDLSVAMPE
jgi:hypothetical protein